MEFEHFLLRARCMTSQQWNVHTFRPSINEIALISTQTQINHRRICRILCKCLLATFIFFAIGYWIRWLISDAAIPQNWLAFTLSTSSISFASMTNLIFYQKSIAKGTTDLFVHLCSSANRICRLNVKWHFLQFKVIQFHRWHSMNAYISQILFTHFQIQQQSPTAPTTMQCKRSNHNKI